MYVTNKPNKTDNYVEVNVGPSPTGMEICSESLKEEY